MALLNSKAVHMSSRLVRLLSHTLAKSSSRSHEPPDRLPIQISCPRASLHGAKSVLLEMKRAFIQTFQRRQKLPRVWVCITGSLGITHRIQQALGLTRNLRLANVVISHPPPTRRLEWRRQTRFAEFIWILTRPIGMRYVSIVQ